MIRIAICGPHGVGKTTLAKRLATELNIWYVPEVAREILDMAQDRNWRTFSPDEATEFERAILYTHLFYVKQANRLGVDFVSDRSIFDVFAYIDWHKKHRNISLNIDCRTIDISSYQKVFGEDLGACFLG